MKRILYALAPAAVAALAYPSPASALNVTYLDPGYTYSNFATLNIRTNAIEVDASGDIYAVNRAYDGTGTAVIERFHSSTGYGTSSVYASYATGNYSATGLEFDSAGNLLTSGSITGGNSGLIYSTDSLLNTSLYYSSPAFRPTGIDSDAAGNLYITGRLQSDLFFGNIYKLDPSLNLSVLVSGFVGKGLAVDASGDIYASNWLDNSIYRFDGLTLTPTVIATFDFAPAELTIGPDGGLYVFRDFGVDIYAGYTEIIRISESAQPVPEPATLVLLGAGGAALVFVRRRRRR